MSDQLTVRHPARTDCHGGHCTFVHTFDQHHVVERSEGGATVPENLATICPNMHRETGDLYALYDEYNGHVPGGLAVGYPHAAHRMAKARWAAKQEGRDRPLNQEWRLY